MAEDGAGTAGLRRRRGSLLWAVTSGALLAAPCGRAMAQTATDTGTANQPPGIARTLADHGVTLTGTYTGEFAANPVGGQEQSSAYNDMLLLGVTFDMGKIAGLTGGLLNVTMTNRDGNSLAARTLDNSVSVQEVYGGGQTYQLTTLTYDQKLFNGLLDLEGGRTEIGDEWATSPLYCYFQLNAVCGNPDAFSKDVSDSFFPIAVWGGRAKLRPTPDIYLQAGVYDNAPPETEPGHHGFDFSTTGSDGASFPVEIGYGTSFADDAYPRHVDVGVVADSSSYPDPFLGTAGQSYVLSGTAPRTDTGRTLVYVQADQMVYRPDPASQRGLSLFGFGMFGTSSTQASRYNLAAGAVYLGPTPSRPLDSIDVAVVETHYNRSTLDTVYDERLLEGGNQYPHADLVMMELNYGWQATPWLNLLPNLQYVVHPDGLAFSDVPVRNLPDALVIGFQATVDLAKLTGL